MLTILHISYLSFNFFAQDDSIPFSPNRRRVIVRTKKSGQTNYDIIETSNLTDQSARLQLSVKEKIFENQPTASTSAVSSSPVVDSEARKRRRQRTSTLNND